MLSGFAASMARKPAKPSATPSAPPSRARSTPFGEELAQQPETPGAERRANRKLFLSGLGACEQQVREVCARDEQHKGDSALEYPQRRRDSADEILLQPVEPDAMALRVRRVHFRIELRPLHQQALDVCARLGQRHAVSQASDEVEEVTAAISWGRGIERQRQPDLHLGVVHVIAGRHDADDPPRRAVDADDAPEHGFVGRERRLPDLG